MCQHLGCVFFSHQNARERVCFWAESVLLDDNSWKYSVLHAIFWQFCSIKGIFQQNFHGPDMENSMFFTKISKRKGVFFSTRQEKGYCFGDRIGTPVYKNLASDPPGSCLDPKGPCPRPSFSNRKKKSFNFSVSLPVYNVVLRSCRHSGTLGMDKGLLKIPFWGFCDVYLS